MTNKQLIRRFRFGFLKVKDKKTNTLYATTGQLAYKVMQIKINIIMMFFVVPIPLLLIIPAQWMTKVVFAFFLYIFESITLVLIGRFLVTEKDMKDVVEEKISQ